MQHKPKHLLTAVSYSIPFHDNDPMGIVWHGNYYKYFEIARDALLERIGYPIPRMAENRFAMPVIESKCRYRHFMTFRQEVSLQAYLSEWENRIVFNYEILDAASGRLLAQGITIHVAFDLNKKELMFVIPQDFQQAILRAIASEVQDDK